MAKNHIRVTRVYDPIPRGGQRILVDGIWPRGFRKEDVPMDVWLKDVAPSRNLRAWYRHDLPRFAEFRRRYLAELADPQHRAAMDELRSRRRQGPVTLLTSVRDVEHSHAAVLAELLEAEP